MLPAACSRSSSSCSGSGSDGDCHRRPQHHAPHSPHSGSSSGRRARVPRSVAVIVGGIAEMFMLHAHHEQIKLRSRRGFVRLALEAGTPIVPTYFFGNSQVRSFGPAALQHLSRRLRASLGVLYGRWGLPLPRKVPLHMAVGVPVPVGPPMSPGGPRFEARVEEVHAAVMAETIRLYYAHREAYGWRERELVVV